MNIKLSAVLKSLESGGRPKGGASLNNNGVPSIGAEHLNDNGSFNFKSIKYIPEEYFQCLKSGKIDLENILIVKDGATTGKVSYVNENFPFHKAAVNEHVFLLKIDKSIASSKYIFQYLRSPLGQRNIMRDFRGATVGGISRGFIEFVSFPLPSLSDQIQIANILSKAEILIEQRKQSIALLDEFLKSTFLKMFGDPMCNENGWEKEICANLFDMKLGKMLSAKNYTGNHLKKYLRNVNVKWGEIDLADLKEMDFSDKEVKNYNLLKGDILVCEGGEVGKTAVLKNDLKDYCFQNAIHRLRIVDFNKINSSYFSWFMFIGVSKGLIIKSTISVTIQHFTQERFKKLSIPLPPIELQTKFANIVTKTESLKEHYKKSLQELENLYYSLSQKAFSEELDFSKENSSLLAADPAASYKKD